MFEHRFQEFLNPSPAAANRPAFVACLCGAFAVTPGQQSFVAEVYRLAQELTEAQNHRPANTRRIPAFSLN